MSSSSTSFADLNLPAPLLKALQDVGYEQPSPIQAESIPYLLEGHDLLGQAQTGTGKTAAFALPLLSRIDLKLMQPQILVLAPTRELAIQVAEAFQSYARYLPQFHVLPIYGGQAYDGQIRALKRGVHVVVGTPGRVMDHMRRGTLRLQDLRALVLDEADEMLRMGFIDDVEWILQQTPAERQIALFSATMPTVIRKVANRYLREPKEVKVKEQTETAKTIRQRYVRVGGPQKLDALTRILEVEDFDGILIFVRTKTATSELAEKLGARGFACEALNGDMAQKLREKTVDRFKRGGLDILVATDVAARGLDVDRISHVINYDIPHDTESYVHRIGRTGRAGRSGEAILFVAPREQHLLKSIERATRQLIEPMSLPQTAEINQQRIARFKQRINEALTEKDLSFYNELIEGMQQEQQVSAAQVAAALASLLQGDEPLLLADVAFEAPKSGRKEAYKERKEHKEHYVGERKESYKAERKPRAEIKFERKPRTESDFKAERKSHVDGDKAGFREKRRERDQVDSGAERKPKRAARSIPGVDLERFRLDVGYQDQVKPGNIVGAIANEAGIESQFIGQIEIFDDYSTVDLPTGMPKEIFNALKNTWVCGKKINLRRVNDDSRLSLDKKPGKRRKHDS